MTKFDQILIIYVKNQEIHVENFQTCHFLKIKKIQRQKSTRIWGGGDWGIYGGGELGYWGGGELIN